MSLTAGRLRSAILLTTLLSASVLQAESASAVSQSARTSSRYDAVSDVENDSARFSQPATDPLDRPLSLDKHRPTHDAENKSLQSPAVGLTMSTIVGGLAFCLGAFLLIVWLTRRNSPTTLGPLPAEVAETLGRMTLNGRQQLQLIRLGKKLVLLSISAQGADSVAEIDDPMEVDRLTGLCQQSRPNSVTATFREVLGQYAREPAEKGYLGDLRQSDSAVNGHVVPARRPTREGFHG